MNRGRIVEGLALILVGGLLLATTLGFMSWQSWFEIARYWPATLVIIGLLVLFRQRVPGLLIAALIILFLVNTASFPLSFIGGWDGSNWSFHGPGSGRLPLPSGTAHLSQPLEQGIETAAVTLNVGAGRLRIEGGSSSLLDGDLDYVGDPPVLSYDRRGQHAQVKIKGGLAGRPLRGDSESPQWIVRLTGAIPVSFEVDAGAGEADMDFSDVRLASLELSAGAGKFTIQLGDHGMRTDVSVKSGAADLALVVPRSVGIRIRVSGAVHEGNMREAGLSRSDGYWVSEDYGTAASSVEIRVSSGVSKVNLQRR